MRSLVMALVVIWAAGAAQAQFPEAPQAQMTWLQNAEERLLQQRSDLLAREQSLEEPLWLMRSDGSVVVVDGTEIYDRARVLIELAVAIGVDEVLPSEMPSVIRDIARDLAEAEMAGRKQGVLNAITDGYRAHSREVRARMLTQLDQTLETVRMAFEQALARRDAARARTERDGAATGAGTCSGAMDGTVTGNWNWFNGGTVTFDSSGSVFSGDEIVARWQCDGSQVVVTWGEPPVYRDRLTLSPNGRELTGIGKEIETDRVSYEGRFATR